MIEAAVRAGTLLLALSVLTFALGEWAPGDFVSTLRASPDLSPETVERMRSRMALDRPWIERYASWCRSALSGDFGISYAYGVPVSQLLLHRLPNTLWLNLAASAAAWAIALLLGSVAARLAGSAIDGAIRAMQALLLGVPELMLVLLGLALFGGLPALPFAVLFFGALPSLLAHVRASVKAALDEPSVRAARSHGIGTARLWWSYVLPLAAPPLIPLAGVSFGSLLSASLLVEATLGYPGLGSLLLDSIQSRDTAVVAAVVALAGTLLMAANLAADLARRAIDPRLRRPTP